MDFYKFEWLINEKRLFMSSSHDLGDSKEGTTSQGEHQRWNEWLQKAKTDAERSIIKLNYEKINQFAQKFSKNYYFVSCWHMNEEETPSKWSDFLDYPEEGVAIKTTIRKLQDCIPEWVNMGTVKYIDHSKDPFQCREGMPLPNFFEWVTSKDKFFEYENEIRCVVDRFTIDRRDSINLLSHDKSGRLAYTPPLNLTHLILNVYISPYAEENQKNLVLTLLKKEKLEHLL